MFQPRFESKTLERQKTAIASLAIATGSTLLSTVLATAAQALPVTYDITITVTDGSLKGNTFTGSFTYDDEKLTYDGQESLSPDDGIAVTMNFLGKDYDATADADYPEFPQIIFQDGAFERLEFWVESEQRGSWWDTPGWNIELSRSGAGLFQ